MNSKIPNKNFIDKTGNRYFRLKVIKLHKYNGKGDTYWECLCDCGKTTYVEHGNLRENRRPIKSCGCLKVDRAIEQSKTNTQDITGQKFNKWTAIERLNGENPKCLWKCRCECGNESNVPITSLKRGYSKCCGCLHVEKLKSQRGEKSPVWNNNLTIEERELSKNRSHNPMVYEWTKLVYKRDGYICQITGKKGKVCAHHLESWNSNKELRLNLDNGIVILEKIHILFHKLYGKGHNTRIQFEKFKKRYDKGEFNNLLPIDLHSKT